MKRLIAIVLALTLIGLAACTNKTTPPDTLPSTSESEIPSVVKTTTSPESEEMTLPTMPATETFSFESKEVRLKFEFPVSWKDKMETVEDVNRFLIFPPSQDYGVPEKKVNLSVYYFDNPWLYGDSFEKTTSEEYLDKILYLEKDKGEKIIEKSPLKMMGKDALMFIYSDVDSEGKETIYRSYFIDDEKGRCYKVSFPVEREGWDGLKTFAVEAQRAVESMNLLILTDSKPAIFEDKDMGFAFEHPGNWHAYKRDDDSWRITPPMRTYDFPYFMGGLSLSYTPPGQYGNSFEEINWPPILEAITKLPDLQIELSKIGNAQALILHTVQQAQGYSATFVWTRILIDAGEGGFYLFGYNTEKDNQAYEPFLAEVKKIVQSFRITGHQYS
jgi:hypothetical protein